MAHERLQTLARINGAREFKRVSGLWMEVRIIAQRLLDDPKQPMYSRLPVTERADLWLPIAIKYRKSETGRI